METFLHDKSKQRYNNLYKNESDDKQGKWTYDIKRGTASFNFEIRNNKITTRKYSVLSFLPMTILLAFIRTSNIYYLMISIIMLVRPDLSPFFPWIMIFQLFFFVLIFMLKEFILEFSRSRYDKFINDRKVMRGLKKKGDMEEVCWRTLEVGDIIKLKKGDICPADVILLDSNDMHNKEAVCYVDSTLLDGKTSLQMKTACSVTQLLTRTFRKNNFTEYRKMLTGTIEYSAPSMDVSQFNGLIKLKKDPKKGVLGINNLILRYSVIKHTGWIFGLVAFTGFETKAMKNSRFSVNKNSFLQRTAEIFSLFSIFIVFIFAVVSTIVLVAKTKDLKFLQQYDETISQTIHIFNYIILYSPMVPIAIYGTVDFLSFLEKFKIQRKYKKLAETHRGQGKKNEYYLRVNDPMALSNLGHVDHVCIDKTGTITRPSFALSKIYVNGKIYQFKDETLKNLTTQYNDKHKSSIFQFHNSGSPNNLLQSQTIKSNTLEEIQEFQVSDQRIDELVEKDQNFAQTRNFGSFTEKNKLNVELPEKIPLMDQVLLKKDSSFNKNIEDDTPDHKPKKKSKLNEYEYLRNSYINPVSSEMLSTEIVFYNDLIRREYAIDDLMKSLILCHGSRVIYEGTEKKYFESYRKEEESMLEFAKCCSYIFEKSNKYENPDVYSLMINSSKSNYDILGINEFSYKRKRFSIVVKNSTEEPTTLYCKGPLESMRSILEIDKEDTENLDSILKNFKDSGLKCVLYAKKRLDLKAAEKYKKSFHNLKFSLMSQTKELEELAIDLESKMELIGVIGLKEEVREEAPEVMNFFNELNIPVWLLSGDSEENVLNSAFSSNLINNTQDPLSIKDDNVEDLFLSIRNMLSEIKLVIDPYKKNIEANQEKSSPTKKRILKRFETGIGGPSRFAISLDVKQLLWNKYIVVNGASFNLIMKDPYLKSHFIFLLAMPKVVIAYNLTPYQKQDFVKIIQNFFENPTVLAIGDGFNDNLMMQMADVSIEIVHFKMDLKSHIRNNAGDIQVNNLKNIKDLLLLDGKSFFERIDNLLLFLFYKEYLLALPLFFYNWYSSFTGSKIMTSLFVFLYQFIFSSASIVIYGIMDKPFKEGIMKKFPGLYLDGAHKKINAVTRFFIRGVTEALVQSVVIFYCTIYMVEFSISTEGYNSDNGELMVIIVAGILFVHNFRLCFICSAHKVWLIWIAFLFVIGLYICYIFASDRRDLEMASQKFTVQYDAVFTRAADLMTFAFIIWLSLIISYLFHRFIYRIGSPTINEYYQSKNEGGICWNPELMNKYDIPSKKLITDEVIIKSQFVEISIGRLVKKIFKSAEIMDNMIQEMLNPADIDLVNLRLRPFTLDIIDPSLNRKFHLASIKQQLNLVRFYVILIVLLFGGYSLADSLTNGEELLGFVRLGVFLYFFGIWMFIWTHFYETHYLTLMSFVLTCGVAACIGFQWATNDYRIALSCALVSVITTLNLNLKFLYVVILNFCFYCSYFAKLGTFYVEIKNFSISSEVAHDQGDINLIKFFVVCSFVVLLLAAGCLNLFILYEDEKLQRNDYLAQSSLELENNIRQDILSILVPKFVKDYINQGITSLQEEQNDVVILFCDICDFDKIIASKGRHIVEILDELFRKYDGICLNNGLQKIETVGKTYMACAGIKACETSVQPNILQIEKTRRVINASFDMLQQAEQNGMKIKIGVNTGKVIAGVIGYHKPQFSLIGDTVNTTSRVCSTGEDGKITISSEAFQKVRASELFFDPRKVEAKGKGLITTYQVTKQPIAKKNIFKEKVTSVLKSLQKQKVAVSKDNAMNEQDIMMKGQDRALNLIKKVFKSNPPKNRFGTPHTETRPLSNNGIEMPQIGLAMKTNKTALINKNFQQDEEIIEGINSDDDSYEDEDNQKYETLKANRYLLYFSPKQDFLAQEFYDQSCKRTAGHLKIMLGAFVFVYLFQTLIIISVRNFIENYLIILLIKGAIAFMMIIFLFLIKSFYKSNIMKFLMFFASMCSMIMAVVQGYKSQVKELNTVQAIELVLLFAFTSYLPPFSFVVGITLFISSIIMFLLTFGLIEYLNQEYCFFFFTYVVFHLMKLYLQKLNLIKSFNNLQKRSNDKIEQEGLVSQLLPAHAFERLKNTNALSKFDLTDEFDDVTLMFADIVGFTKYSSSVSAEQVVNMLRSLFTEFDKCCLKFKVYKVYTIGDCYVVMGFTNAFKRNPVEEAHNVVKMGLSMIDIIRTVRELIGFKDLDMRIGVHTGHIIGGIIGTDIVRYDIYGKDVALANKMESNGVEGNIMVSESTKSFLEKDKNMDYKFELKKQVECKAYDHPVNGYLIISDYGNANETNY